MVEKKLTMAARMGARIPGFEVGILADGNGRMAQLEANILSAGPTGGKLFPLKQRRLVLRAMLPVRHQVKSRLRDRFARFINVFRHESGTSAHCSESQNRG